MSEDKKTGVDTDSAKFKQGVEAGLNSEEDSKNWQAGNELGQELKEEDKIKEPVKEVPLFLRDTSGVLKGRAQDEKDEMEE